MARNRNPRNYGEWAILPDDMLTIVLMRLGFFDFFSFASVCTSWRDFSRNQKENFFIKKHQPFIIIISLYAKRACSFLNIFDRNRYKTLLPNIMCKSVLGLSGGYIIMNDIQQTWIINPLTKDERPYPSLSTCFTQFNVPNFRSVVVYLPEISDYYMIAVCRGDNHFIMSRPGRKYWQMFKLPLPSCSISDLSFFKGKLYILTITCEIYQLSIFPYLDLTQLEIKSAPGIVSRCLQLVATDERLFIVDFKVGNPFVFFEVDFSSMEFVKTVNLGDEALFFSEIKSCSLANPAKWGGRSNCIYVLELLNSKCACYSLDGTMISTTHILEPNAVRCQPYLWYIPPLSCNQHILEY